MELTDINILKSLAKQNGIHPSRQSGQNFLVSKKTLKKIIEEAKLTPADKVLEIGPGFGTLTVELLKTGAQVTAVELDKKLAKFSKKYEKLYKNFKIFEKDILKSRDLLKSEFEDLNYKLISNLPYTISSKVLRNFTEQYPRPNEIIIMLQKEVAERVISTPGNMSVLAVAVQFYGTPKKLFDVEARDFWPEPEIKSSVLQISQIGIDKHGYQKKLSPKTIKDFFRAVKIGFSAKRKQIHNNLANGFHISDQKTVEILKKIAINPKKRAQDLNIEDWISITHEFC